MKSILCLVLLFLGFSFLGPVPVASGSMGTSVSSGSIEFPPGGFVEGWQLKGESREYNKNGLYGYIDGGAELFLEFGFDVLRLQKYQSGESEISVEVYRMTSPEAALGIYLMKCGDEIPVNEIPARNTGDAYQFTILKGSCFITVNNYDGKKEFLPVMVKLANKTLESIGDEKPQDLFSLLPKENLVEGSKLIVRGMYTLQSVYTLGEGDILSLKNETFGVTAQYKENDNSISHLLVVKYKSADEARRAFSYLCANLDSYITVKEKGETSLTFTDYKGKEGRVLLEGELLRIRFSK